MEKIKQNIGIQKTIAIFSILLFIVKVVAYFLTNSVSVLTDALESTVNIVASFIGLYSLNLSAKPADEDHPYGHGKAEFISAGIEGALIFFAGLIIIYEGINNFIFPHKVKDLDYGIILILITAIVNFIIGYATLQKGKKNNSLPLVSSGKHLMSDTYSTLGIVVGLVLVYFTKWLWLDNIVAMIFGSIICYTGIKIIRESLAGIMDESDRTLLNEIIEYAQENRQASWIDLHNLRVIKYGSILHIDAHLTMPYYYTVEQAHKQVNAFENLIKEKYGTQVELFIHIDDCLEFSCEICKIENCKKRRLPFAKEIIWNIDNSSINQKHSVES